MKKKITTILLITLILSGFISSCKRQSPQLPSNKGNEPDKNNVFILDVHQELAIKEDSTIRCYAKKDKSFKKNELGFWYKIDKETNGTKIKGKKVCNFECTMKLLNGKVLEEDKKQIVLGKKQIVTGLEEGLKLLHEGESATFIVPSCLGYGMKGNLPLVPPFTPLIFQIKLCK